MKTKIFSFGLLLTIMITFSAWKTLTPVGPHGGVVKQAGDYKIELLKSFDSFTMYLLDRNAKTFKNKGITGNVIFMLPDNTNSEVPVKLSGDESFMCGIPSAAYVSMQITFHVQEKSFTAKFENETILVEKK